MPYNESPEFKKLFAKFVESNRANGIDPHKPEPDESPDFKKLFAEFVEGNRANGIDPRKPEPEGRVCMIRTDDVYWDTGRTLSSQQIDKLFRKLKL